MQKEDDDDDYFGDGPLGQKMPKPEPEPGEMIPDEPTTGKKGKRKKKKKGLKAVSLVENCSVRMIAKFFLTIGMSSQ